ncbi:hypothetical protein YDYSY3_45210 [Paenibacillus chitinolyticus]|uniref:hypothetical protein n=1 Tax=Paenibacillus chitinolyticus TaxID=79263 RepID=UPI0026E4E745|nr:hypothetical protein [Paenibacillus chitinolyticus]GKS13521.1 hypothetical protein YDYSY3_45210 [Paenibacillus chitinolyticus]
MSNEALLGIIVTVVLGIGALLITTKKNSIKISQKNKNGNANMNNNTISNEINTDKRK